MKISFLRRLRTKTGTLISVVGDHMANWRNADDAMSTLDNVQVPVFKGDTRWGTFEVSFRCHPYQSAGVLLAKTGFQTVGLSYSARFFGFYLLMKKTLEILDPSAVVPERVKVALDSLVEGVVVMDQHERIVLANKAFEKTMGEDQATLMGRKTSDLDWMASKSSNKIKEFPWRQALQDGINQTAISLEMKKDDDHVRTFMVNGAPILDGEGKTRGALATFDDVTKLEAQNTQLQRTLNVLKKSRNAIRRQNETLQILATQDPLTHCLNRRAFFERFEKEFGRTQRYDHDLSCVMVDIDHFKSINDNHGHPVGDKVLQKVSSIIRHCLRDSDVLCRYGGEEFCIMLPETGLPGALKTAERIRATLAAKEVLGIAVTISLGVSTLDCRYRQYIGISRKGRQGAVQGERRRSQPGGGLQGINR